MKEFDLIKEIVLILGDRASGDWVRVGPGDDCSVVSLNPGYEVVSSIDSLNSGVHFPEGAPAELIGYRSLMVSLSDIAAMGAEARYVLVNLCLPADHDHWALECARGIKKAATDNQVYVCGGNLTRGHLCVTVSAHGEVPAGKSTLRSGAKIGDSIFVSGSLGGAASYIRQINELTSQSPHFEKLKQSFYQPSSCLQMIQEVQNKASACIDISDGLIQDLKHILLVSSVGAGLVSTAIPVCEGSDLSDALYGGDDYQLLCTSSADMADFYRIGTIISGSEILLDDVVLTDGGYDHFGA